jgi:hypothetical protein
MRGAIFLLTLSLAQVASAEQTPQRDELIEHLEMRQARAEQRFRKAAEVTRAAMTAKSVRLAAAGEARLAADHEVQHDFTAQVQHAERNAQLKSAATLAGIGAGMGVVAGVFALLAESKNGTIRHGNFATGADIQSAGDTGRAYNIISVSSAVLGGAFLAVGLVIVLR